MSSKYDLSQTFLMIQLLQLITSANNFSLTLYIN